MSIRVIDTTGRREDPGPGHLVSLGAGVHPTRRGAKVGEWGMADRYFKQSVVTFRNGRQPTGGRPLPNILIDNRKLVKSVHAPGVWVNEAPLLRPHKAVSD